MKEEPDEVEELPRIPSYYSQEHVKYLRNQLSGKLEDDAYSEFSFNLVLRDDKKLSPEMNAAIRVEVGRRVNEMKKKLFEKMWKLQQGIYFWVNHISTELNEKGVFDEKSNQIRIRSLFKVELEK